MEERPPEKLDAQMTANGCRWNNRSAAPLRGCYRCVPCADGTKTKLHRSADAGSLPSSSEDYDSPRSLGR